MVLDTATPVKKSSRAVRTCGRTRDEDGGGGGGCGPGMAVVDGLLLMLVCVSSEWHDDGGGRRGVTWVGTGTAGPREDVVSSELCMVTGGRGGDTMCGKDLQSLLVCYGMVGGCVVCHFV